MIWALALMVGQATTGITPFSDLAEVGVVTHINKDAMPDVAVWPYRNDNTPIPDERDQRIENSILASFGNGAVSNGASISKNAQLYLIGRGSDDMSKPATWAALRAEVKGCKVHHTETLPVPLDAPDRMIFVSRFDCGQSKPASSRLLSVVVDAHKVSGIYLHRDPIPVQVKGAGYTVYTGAPTIDANTAKLRVNQVIQLLDAIGKQDQTKFQSFLTDDPIALVLGRYHKLNIEALADFASHCRSAGKWEVDDRTVRINWSCAANLPQNVALEAVFEGSEIGQLNISRETPSAPVTE